MIIQELLDKLQIPNAGREHRHGRSGWIQVDCPYCGPSSGKFHLGISEYSGSASCWRCGKHSLYKVLALSTSSRGLLSSLWKSLEFDWKSASEYLEAKGIQGNLVMPKNVTAMTEAHRRYIREKRGLDDTYCERVWGVQGIGVSSYLSWRLFIPVVAHGRTVSWTTRTIGDKKEAKYISAKLEESVIPIDYLVYGIDYCFSSIIVHEGPLDVWTMGPGSTCIFGLGFTEAQVKQISRFPLRILCFDNEEAAQDKAEKLAKQIDAFPGETYIVRIESGKDINSADPEELSEIRKTFGLKLPEALAVPGSKPE